MFLWLLHATSLRVLDPYFPFQVARYHMKWKNPADQRVLLCGLHVHLHPVFVMFVSWDKRIALVNSALCHDYIYACAPEPSPDAHGKDAQRHEGLAYREADHFQAIQDRHRGNGLYFRAKVERKRDPSLLALSFDVDFTGCHVINHLVQNISRTLVTQHVLKFTSARLQKTVDFDIYKIFEDLFPSKDERDSMFLEGIHDENLNQISSNTRNKLSSGVTAETALGAVLGSKY